MSNINVLWELTIVIRQLPCLFSIAEAVSSTVDPVNSVTSDSVNLYNFAICTFTRKCFLIELVPCSDGWRRTWWQMIYMMEGLLLSSIPQCKFKRHEGACLELFQSIEHLEPTFIEVQQASNMMYKVRSPKWRIKTCLVVENIITLSNKVFKGLEFDMAVGIWILRNSTWETFMMFHIVKWNAGT